MSPGPLVAFDLIESRVADAALLQWGHWLGPCARPFGRQSFGLTLHGELVARLCVEPGHRDLTRVALRLWRRVGPPAWAARYWSVTAAVSYCNRNRHSGDIYRFDGWRKVADVRGGVAGGGWGRGKVYEPKSVWVFDLKDSA